MVGTCPDPSSTTTDHRSPPVDLGVSHHCTCPAGIRVWSVGTVVEHGSVGRFRGYRGLHRELVVRQVTPEIGIAATLAPATTTSNAARTRGTGGSAGPSARMPSRGTGTERLCRVPSVSLLFALVTGRFALGRMDPAQGPEAYGLPGEQFRCSLAPRRSFDPPHAPLP
jgi:hypothetical protein